MSIVLTVLLCVKTCSLVFTIPILCAIQIKENLLVHSVRETTPLLRYLSQLEDESKRLTKWEGNFRKVPLDQFCSTGGTINWFHIFRTQERQLLPKTTNRNIGRNQKSIRRGPSNASFPCTYRKELRVSSGLKVRSFVVYFIFCHHFYEMIRLLYLNWGKR